LGLSSVSCQVKTDTPALFCLSLLVSLLPFYFHFCHFKFLYSFSSICPVVHLSLPPSLSQSLLLIICCFSPLSLSRCPSRGWSCCARPSRSAGTTRRKRGCRQAAWRSAWFRCSG